MLDTAVLWPQGRFAAAGLRNGPDRIAWPENVERPGHLSPSGGRVFYNSLRFALSLSRAGTIRSGCPPEARLLEAAACGVPVISDSWKGPSGPFRVGTEILVSRGPEDTLMFLRSISEEGRRAIGERARKRVLAEHTAACRAAELESHARQLLSRHSTTVPVNGLRSGAWV